MKKETGVIRVLNDLTKLNVKIWAYDIVLL